MQQSFPNTRDGRSTLRGSPAIWQPLLGIVAACISMVAHASIEQKVYVLDAIDGDTVQLQREHGGLARAHLLGVEAPGTDKDKRHPSKLSLGALAFGRWGTAQCDPVVRPKEGARKVSSKPLLCRVQVDGKDLSLAQLEAGQARFSERYAGLLSKDDRDIYRQAERDARQARKGMWSNGQ